MNNVLAQLQVDSRLTFHPDTHTLAVRSTSPEAIERRPEASRSEAAFSSQPSAPGHEDSPATRTPHTTSAHARTGVPPASRRTIFERYGGFAKINRVVTSFYEKILDSPITSPYFAHVDMRAMIDHQTRFIAMVLGGPASYTNDHLERVHARHHITEDAFHEACALLVEALEDHDFADEDIQVVVDEFMARKHYIVSRS